MADQTMPQLIELGRPLLDVKKQPASCGDACPCNIGPADFSAYGMHWNPSGGPAGFSWLGGNDG